jgi:hypothetical protein
MDASIYSGLFALAGAAVGGASTIAATLIERRWGRAKRGIRTLADQVAAFHHLAGRPRLALHQPEWNAVTQLLKLRREQLAKEDPSISGWNVGLNSGEAAGQTVLHAHWHLIPRRQGDCEQPPRRDAGGDCGAAELRNACPGR